MDIPAPGGLDPDAERALFLMGRVLDAITLYGPKHPSVARLGGQAHALWERILAARGEVNLGIDEDNLTVDGVAVLSPSPFIRTLADRLRALDIGGFCMRKGMAAGEFADLVGIMARADRDRFRQGGGGALQHVVAEKVLYRRVRDGEVVVGDEHLAEVAGASPDQLAAITAYLRGGGAGAAQEVGDALRTLLEDGSPRVAGMMLEGVRDAIQGSPDDTAQAAGQLVEQVRRACESVRQTAAADTKKGRQQLRKAFLDIEGHLKAGVEEAGLAWEGGLGEPVHEAVEEIAEELQIETLVADATRTRSTLGKHEKRLLRYINRNWDEEDGGEELRERLVGAGLPVTLWADLVARSGLSATGQEGLAGRISESLQRLHELLGGGNVDEERVREVLEAVSHGMAQAVREAERVLNDLAEAVREDTDSAAPGEGEEERPGPRQDMKWLWERLAELGQELLQPLTVINASVSMTLTGLTGDLTGDQRDLLGCADESGQKLKSLMDRFVAIVGYPACRHARSDIIFDERLDGRAGTAGASPPGPDGG